MASGSFSDHCLMFSVAILNLICGVLGGLVFCLGIWMRAEPDVREWVAELEMYQYWNGLYILIAASAIVMIISFCGCCGALTNSILLMTIGAASVFLTLILIVAGSTLVLLHGTSYSQLTPYLSTKFDRLILDSKYDGTAYYYLTDIQEKVGCCGGRNYMDYNTYNMPISDTCRDAISGNVYQQGCVQQLAIFIEKRSGWIASIALFVAFLQIFLVCFTFCYVRSVRGNEEFGHRYKEVAH